MVNKTKVHEHIVRLVQEKRIEGITAVRDESNREGVRFVIEVTHLMVISFYMRSKLYPYKKAENPDPRTTDDHFLMEVVNNGNEEEVVKFLKSTGAVEVKLADKKAIQI